MDTDGDGISISNSSLIPFVVGNKPYNLNPHALTCNPSDLLSNNMSDKFPSDAVTFIPPTSVCDGHAQVISIIFFLLLPFVFMVLSILNVSGELSKNVMTPKESIKKLTFESPNKLIIGHLKINSMRNFNNENFI